VVEIYYIDSANREQLVTYDNYEAYALAQMGCLLNIQDHYKVSKVVIDGNVIEYDGNFGNLYYFLENQQN
jgi:hypothetical protein